MSADEFVEDFDNDFGEAVEPIGLASRPVWWNGDDRVRIDLLDGKRVEAGCDDVELLTWGISVASGWAWPWHMVRSIRVQD